MAESDDCCSGEPAMGDPRGLHTDDCPVYQANVAAWEAQHREQHGPPQPDRLDDPVALVGRHDALLAGAYDALVGDQSAAANAVRAALLVHVSQPAPEGSDQPPCAVCVGTGQGRVDGHWVHCCCACPICSCGQPACDNGCDTVEAIAEALGVVVSAGGGPPHA